MAEESRINDNNNLVPNNTISIVTDHDCFNESVFHIVETLKGNKKRDWWNPHFYYCLPLLIGNQYGFIIKSLYDFSVTWNGMDDLSAVTIQINQTEFENHQLINSHFGSGIVTVQNRFHFRTPPGVNLITIDPPNFLLPNMKNLTGVIETDNLRRDFTFNIKITQPNVEIKIKKGQPIAAVFPVQRYFTENFELKLAKDLFSPETIENERAMGRKFAEERNTVDRNKPHQAGRRYWKGEDADNINFPDHQNKIH